MEIETTVSRPLKRPFPWKKAALATVLGLALAAVFAWRVMFYMPGESFSGELPPISAAAGAPRAGPSLVDQLKRDVTTLAVEIGPRNLRRPAKLAAAAKFVEQELARAGYQPAKQTYQVEGRDCWNIQAEIRGARQPDEIVLVGAHYDTYDTTPGADDNASGTAAMLALARRFARGRPQRTLRFVAFTNEEPPYFQRATMGSLVYARGCRRRNENLTCVLSLETMGYFSDAENSQQYPSPLNLIYPSTGNFIGVVGNVASRPLVHKVVASLRRHIDFPSQGGAVPDVVDGVGWSDHWSFWQEGYQAVMITDTALFRNPNYHRPSDTPATLNFDHLARVVIGLEGVLREMTTPAGKAAPAAKQE